MSRFSLAQPGLDLVDEDGLLLLPREVAGGGAAFGKGRPLVGAAVARYFAREGTARVEGAAGRRVEQGGRWPRDGGERLVEVAAEPRHGAQQAPGVRVLGRAKHLA